MNNIGVLTSMISHQTLNEDGIAFERRPLQSSDYKLKANDDVNELITHPDYAHKNFTFFTRKAPSFMAEMDSVDAEGVPVRWF